MSLQIQIQQKLETAFAPLHLEVQNESHMHGVPAGSESHFKIVVVSSKFEGLMLLKRHRAVNEILSTEISQVRAIALHTFTAQEWEKRQAENLRSPGCVGGSKM